MASRLIDFLKNNQILKTMGNESYKKMKNCFKYHSMYLKL